MNFLDRFRGKEAETNKPEADKPSQAVTDFADPFQKSCVSRVAIFIYNRAVFHDNPSYEGQATFQADIEFKNGSSSGEQKIKAENFPELVEKINGFIKGMK